MKIKIPEEDQQEQDCDIMEDIGRLFYGTFGRVKPKDDWDYRYRSSISNYHHVHNGVYFGHDKDFDKIEYSLMRCTR